ncbi:MAG: sporulation protein YunB [Clostridium sp.]|jgi:sporulation protein yunB|nr:sporulation protein YunB [Clostridium sp.]
MKYYRKKKLPSKLFILIIVTILIIFNLGIYFFNKIVFPSVLKISETMIKSKTIEKISETSIELFNDEFNYDEMIIINRDNEGNINLIQANTMKLNYLASKLSVECNKTLQSMGEVEMKVPLGWISKNSAFYRLGPKINVKIEPIGNMNVTYESKFESAGINQTRHTIYLKVESKIRIAVPFQNKEIDVLCEIPVSETIIVGKIPSTAIDFSK